MSSPITLSGFNNIDFKSIVDILINAEREPINRLGTQKGNEQNRLSAYTSLSTNLSTLQSAFSAAQASSAYGSLQASSSDTEILAASATSSASKGSFTIDVTSLARPQVTSSSAGQFSDINATIIDGGTFSITQNGTSTSIDLTGVSTLAQLRNAINGQQSGVKASIINDGSTSGNPPEPFRLVLTSAASGVDSAFSVDDQTTFDDGTPGAILNLSTSATNGVAQDTVFTYNGITIRSASTTITDAIPGLSLKLLKTGSSTVTITDDDSVLRDKIQAIVTAFNSFNDFAQGQFKLATDGSSRPPLASDPLLRGINRQLRDFFTSNHANSGSIQNLVQLGVKLTQSGKLEIDDATLENALANSRSDVQTFLADTTGFAAKVSNFIQSYTQAGGAIDSVEHRIQTTIDSYNDRIQTLEGQLVLREQTLNQQFAAADRAISQLNSQGNALSRARQSISNFLRPLKLYFRSRGSCMTPDSPSNVYQQMEVTTANNLRLVVLLYEGAVRFLTEAKNSMVRRDLAGKARAIDRTFAILGELQSTLKVEEGGEIAVSLDRLYVYMMDRVLEASSKLDIEPLDEVIRLLRLLNSAWTEIAQQADKVSTTVPDRPVTSMMPTSAGQRPLSHHPLEVVA